jgi:hypothetical protein
MERVIPGVRDAQHRLISHLNENSIIAEFGKSLVAPRMLPKRRMRSTINVFS